MRTKTKPEVREIAADSTSHEVEVVSLTANGKGNVTVKLSSHPYNIGIASWYTVSAIRPFDADLELEITRDEAENITIGDKFRIHIERA